MEWRLVVSDCLWLIKLDLFQAHRTTVRRGLQVPTPYSHDTTLDEQIRSALSGCSEELSHTSHFYALDEFVRMNTHRFH
jgi:hypothetical protein